MTVEIEVREARAFAVLAEQLNFTRAARLLEMSQPSLSQQISRLERRLGFPLFRRSKRAVSLTPAGQALLVEARRFLAAEGSLQEVAHVLERSQSSVIPLRIGASTSIVLGALPQAMEDLGDVMPVVRQMNEIEQTEALARGELDIGLQRTWPSGKADHVMLYAEPLYAACRADHPAAQATACSLKAFAQDSFMIFRQEMAPSAYAAIARTIARSGMTFPITRFYRDEGDFIGLVACGAGFGIVPASMTRVRIPRIAYVRIEDPQAVSPVSLRYDRENPAVAPAAHRLAQRLRRAAPDGSSVTPEFLGDG